MFKHCCHLRAVGKTFHLVLELPALCTPAAEVSPDLAPDPGCDQQVGHLGHAAARHLNISVTRSNDDIAEHSISSDLPALPDHPGHRAVVCHVQVVLPVQGGRAQAVPPRPGQSIHARFPLELQTIQRFSQSINQERQRKGH